MKNEFAKQTTPNSTWTKQLRQHVSPAFRDACVHLFCKLRSLALIADSEDHFRGRWFPWRTPWKQRKRPTYSSDKLRTKATTGAMPPPNNSHNRLQDCKTPSFAWHWAVRRVSVATASACGKQMRLTMSESSRTVHKQLQTAKTTPKDMVKI